MNPSPRPTLLLIDDDPDILKLMEFVFAGEHLELVTRRTPEEGFQVIATRAVDCALVDIHFARTPECFGFLAALRSLPGKPPIPVLATSAMVGHEVMQRTLELGARAFIPKPFYPGEVLQAVRAVLADPAPAAGVAGGKSAPPLAGKIPTAAPRASSVSTAWTPSAPRSAESSFT